MSRRIVLFNRLWFSIRWAIVMIAISLFIGMSGYV